MPAGLTVRKGGTPIAALAILCTLLAGAAAALAKEPRLTATLSPAKPVIGVTRVVIAGRAGAGDTVTDSSTFPDGSVHQFSAKADASGVFRDGPFVLQQLGTYRDVLRDETTGATAVIVYSGRGDYAVTAEHDSYTIAAGSEMNIAVTIKSLSGFGGVVQPVPTKVTTIPGAVPSWSVPFLRVPPGGSASVNLNLFVLVGTAPGNYSVSLRARNGSVTRSAKSVKVTVTGPQPGAITAALAPPEPVVGATQVVIKGRATPGEWVTDTSTFPDGSTHKFSLKATGAGLYTDGPFVLRQLGTYHDVLMDAATGATTALSYSGVGDFTVAIDNPRQSAGKGEEASFLVTFTSLSGFAGVVIPRPPDLSQIPGATAAWSAPRVAVAPGREGAAKLTIKIPENAPAGTYKLTVAGANGGVSHAVPEVALTIR